MATPIIADISRFNGTVDFAKMKTAGVAGVVIKVGYRGYGKSGTMNTENTYKRNMDAAVKVGLPVGVYWISQAISSVEAEAEADYVAAAVKGYRLFCPVWLDLEYSTAPNRTGRADKLSAKNRTTYAIAFLRRLEKHGLNGGVYCDVDFIRDELIRSKLGDYPLWLASYSAKSAPDGCAMWQYTKSGDGKIFGSGGNGGIKTIDLSYLYRTDWLRPVIGLPMLRRGDTGPAVKVLQHRLNDIIDAALDVDGDFGPATEQAVVDAQECKGLDVDKVVGPLTWGALV